MSTNPIRTPRFVNLQAPNAALFWQAVAYWLAQKTKREITFETEGHWSEWRDQLALGEATIGTACGSYYVQWADDPTPLVELLAAPVMVGERYGGHPVHFSDVVVRADGPIESLDDLAGGRWAYNEPNSYSGCHVARYELALRGLPMSYFDSMVESGSHQTSLSLIAAGAVDAAAIDSVVLEAEFRARPERARSFRILESWGPTPIPPVIASMAISPAWRERWRTTLLSMHVDRAGRQILADGGVVKFVGVTDVDYDPIRARMR